MSYDNTNSGALFKNDKQGNENRPDYKGFVNVDGQEFWLSAWINKSKKDGSKYMALKLEAKKDDMQQQKEQNRQHQNFQQPSQQAAPPDDLEDIPFAGVINTLAF